MPDSAATKTAVSAGHDLALVRLKRAWGGELAHLWLEPSDEESVLFGTRLYIVGFGEAEPIEEKRRVKRYARAGGEVFFAGSAVLLQGEVLKFPTAICAERYGKAFGTVAIAAGEICASTLRGRQDGCQGDSGGPLSVQVTDRVKLKDRKVQIGVVSWGKGCGDHEWPGIYTRLSTNADWIRHEAQDQLPEHGVGHFVFGDPSTPDHSLALYDRPEKGTATKLATMRLGTNVYVLATRADGWWRIRIADTGQTGWALSEFITCCKS